MSENPSIFKRVPIATSPGMTQTSDGNMYNGLPFRGKPYPIKKNDPENAKPQYGMEVHVRQFDLSQKEDLKDYVAIFQQVANQTAFISFEEKTYDSELKSWRVLLRWADSYYEAPKAEVLDQRIPQ